MSVCTQTPEEESGSEDLNSLNHAASKMVEQKPVSKVFRVLTVVAYLVSVSLAAILLSVYYVWVWKSPEPPMDDGQLDALRGGALEYGNYEPINDDGGLNTTVSNAPPAPSLPTINDDVTDLTSSNVSDVTDYNTTLTPSDVNATLATATSSSDYNDTDST